MVKLLWGCSGKSLPLIRLFLMNVWVNGILVCGTALITWLTSRKDGELDWQSSNIPLSAFNVMELDQTLG